MAGVDSSEWAGKSPRGVVEQPWKHGQGLKEKYDAASRQNSASHQEDDYASHTLTATGIPHDDPAWYETESEAYNYDTGGLGVCLNMIRLHSAVISLSFHPSGEILAMASGSTLHLWDYKENERKRAVAMNAGSVSLASGVKLTTRESDARILNRSQNSTFPQSQTMDFRHESALRCVHFPPNGTSIIIGGVNPQSSNEGLPNARGARSRGGMSGGGMSFHLRMWDFDLDAVLE
eukprot:CAMPEP_0172317562 /NCGR_PEP_ID=MMETSP1058-20130122/32007_1 /TAXON_ID=83371 /ORGANISM="Detonula confervacea, Strain CCMP 353" /LENGTH=233 /DNA_ID=CAMNT_0013032149 /DNA_START=27 /DNA_END=725 /DNA_ORIENTATION=-